MRCGENVTRREVNSNTLQIQRRSDNLPWRTTIHDVVSLPEETGAPEAGKSTCPSAVRDADSEEHKAFSEVDHDKNGDGF